MITLSTKSYNQDRVQPDAVSYVGPAHTLSSKDLVEYKRVYPKPTALFAGVARPSIKMVRTVTLADGVTKADAIFHLQGSLPVGITSASVDSMLADLGSAIALEIAGTTTLAKTLKLQY